MDTKIAFEGFLVESFIVLDARSTIKAQPKPTSPRIKELLTRGLNSPETLTPQEVRELSASVVYDLIMRSEPSSTPIRPTQD